GRGEVRRRVTGGVTACVGSAHGRENPTRLVKNPDGRNKKAVPGKGGFGNIGGGREGHKPLGVKAFTAIGRGAVNATESDQNHRTRAVHRVTSSVTARAIGGVL